MKQALEYWIKARLDWLEQEAHRAPELVALQIRLLSSHLELIQKKWTK